jgi:uncharacterized membrane protein YozB (DUF420 family)
MTWGVELELQFFFSTEKNFLYILRCSCTFHVTLRVAFPFLHLLAIVMAGQLKAQAHPLMVMTAASVFGLAAAAGAVVVG